MNSSVLTHPQRLQAADHLRACTLGNQVVVLDLLRSKYFSLGLDQWHRLSRSQPLPPLDQPAGRHTNASDHPPQLPEALPEPDSTVALAGTARAVETLQPADHSWSEPSGDAGHGVGVLRTCRLLRAAAWAAYTLRMHSLQHIAGSVSRTTSRLQHARADKHPLLDEAVAAFHALRPLLHTSRDRCLQDSLALVRFLASESIAAHWVIGVKSAPFAAHAWVQAGGLVLNDLHDNVRHYKPILVV
jgi:Transglutaminase-like superfamily